MDIEDECNGRDRGGGEVISYGYKLQVTGYKLQVTGYRLQVTSYRLQVTGYKLKAPDRIGSFLFIMDTWIEQLQSSAADLRDSWLRKC